jgi:hypothetical protein
MPAVLAWDASESKHLYDDRRLQTPVEIAFATDVERCQEWIAVLNWTLVQRSDLLREQSSTM